MGKTKPVKNNNIESDTSNLESGHLIITPFLSSKMNVFGSRNRLANLTDPKLVIFRLPILNIIFRPAPAQKWRSSFG